MGERSGTADLKSTTRMVEGDECHRIKHQHQAELVGKRFKADSPNGRFTEGAAAISGQTLDRIEIHGKNLFYFFGPTVVHIHFGMAGQFAVYKKAPDPKPATRLRLQGEGIVCHLSAMTGKPTAAFQQCITALISVVLEQFNMVGSSSTTPRSNHWDRIRCAK